MPRLRSIRAKVVLAITGLVALSVCGVAAGAALVARRQAEARVRADLERTARVIVDGGFLSSRETLGHIARFIAADVATFDETGPIAIAPTPRPYDDALFGMLVRGELPSGDLAHPTVTEVDLLGGPVTIVAAKLKTRGSLALIFPGRVLEAARREALLPVVVAGAGGLALALAAALALGRSIARPVEALARAAARIRHGERDARLEVRTGDEVESLARALDDMVRGLQDAEARAHEAERLAAMGRLLSGLAHELKNPLAAIRMTVQLVAEKARAPRDAEALQMVLDEVEKLSTFSTKLLTYARGPVVQPRPHALRDVVDEVLRVLARQLEHLGIDVRVEAPEGCPPAQIDAVAFRHVVMNLLLNAAEAMPGGGRAVVRIEERAPGRLHLAVLDAGAGIPPEDVPRIFEPFFSRKPSGTGLGLATCRAIVEAHGGTIAHEARSPRGSIFVVDVAAAVLSPVGATS